MTKAIRDAAQALLPCPFCGHSKNIAIANTHHDHSGGYYIGCPECDASTGIVYACMDDPRQILAERWNRRAAIAAPAPSPDERVAEHMRKAMTTISQRLREIALHVCENHLIGAGEQLLAIAAELEAAPAGAHAEPVGNADMPVVAYECTEGIEQERLLRWSLPAGEFVGGKEPLIRQRDALAAIASRDERIADLEDALQKSGESVVRFSDAWTEAQRRVIELEADLREARDRIASMRTEWAEEAAMLTSQAQFQAGVADALKARVAELTEKAAHADDVIAKSAETQGELARLTAQARRAEDCLEAAKARIDELEAKNAS